MVEIDGGDKPHRSGTKFDKEVFGAENVGTQHTAFPPSQTQRALGAEESTPHEQFSNQGSYICHQPNCRGRSFRRETDLT